MTIETAFHFTSIPTITHSDFPKSKTPFTCAVLVDEDGTEHKIFLPLGCRLVVTKGQTDE